MKIKETSLKLDISEDTLRYYEKVGLIGPINKVNGIRDYNKEDLKNIEFIKCMRSAGLSINILSLYMKLLHEGSKTIDERKKLLIEQKDLLKIKINEMNETLEKLEYKIKNYETIMNKYERNK